MILLSIPRGQMVRDLASTILLKLIECADMVLAATSLLVAAAYNPLKVARQIWPHLAVLGIFVIFVVWNGGVVLGTSAPYC